MKELLEMVLLRDVNLMPISTGEHLRLGEGTLVFVDRDQFQNESLHRVDIFLPSDTSRSRFSLNKSELSTPFEWVNQKIEDKLSISSGIPAFKYPFTFEGKEIPFQSLGRPKLKHCVIDSKTGDTVARFSKIDDAKIMAYVLSYKNEGKMYICSEKD